MYNMNEIYSILQRYYLIFKKLRFFYNNLDKRNKNLHCIYIFIYIVFYRPKIISNVDN